MVSFFRTVLKWLAALIVACGLLLGLVFLVLVGVSVALQPEPVEIRADSVLVVDLALNLVDSPSSINPVDEVLGEIQGTGRYDVALRHALTAIDRARGDDRIAGILLQGNLAGAGYGNSLAALREFRGKLAEFRASGKPVWGYLDNDSLGDFYIKSVAEHVWMNPYGTLDFKGLGAEVVYWGATFDRFGIGVQVEKAGSYKSAAESFVDSTMSPENREQLEALLGTVWLQLRQEIAESRGLTVEELDRLATEKGLFLSREVLEARLVDELVQVDEAIEALIGAGDFDASADSFASVDFATYVKLDSRPYGPVMDSGRDRVAVVYAEGVIVDGEGQETEVGGDRVSRLLREMRLDDQVKAVVLRVNSPGGSATASEKILREVALTNAEKPVVVSMGGYAASGGYLISTLAETIFAEPTTITGSIGVVSLLPNVEELMGNYDLNVERVETNPLATMFSPYRAKTEAEMARMQDFVEAVYGDFLGYVAQGRGMELLRVRELAEGRVWAGATALEIGLADRLGGLQEAIAHAGDLAGLGDRFEVVDHPRAQTLEEVIASWFGGGRRVRAPRVEVSAAKLLGNAQLETLEAEMRWLRQINDPRHLYAYSPLRLRW